MDFGLIWIIVVIIGLVYSVQALKEVNEDVQEYLSGLGYRISRSEQEALIRMPIGIILLNESEKIDWINPYMQAYLNKRDVLGLTLDELDTQLASSIKIIQMLEKQIQSHGKINNSHFMYSRICV